MSLDDEGDNGELRMYKNLILNLRTLAGIGYRPDGTSAAYSPVCARAADALETLTSDINQQGRCIEWGRIAFGRTSSFTTTVNRDDVIRCLRADAEDRLPLGTRYEIREKMPQNYGRTFGMAWLRDNDMDEVASWGEGDFPRTIGDHYYMVIGQFTTPQDELPLPITTGARDL